MTGNRAIPIYVLSALLGLAACGGDSNHDDPPGGHDHEHVAGAVRALVSDENGNLTLYDVQDGQVVWEHAFDGIDAASLTGLSTSEDGRFGTINLRGAENRVRFLDSGVAAEEHGDHFHLEVKPPALLDYSINGDDYGASRVAHVVSHHERVSVFFDGEPGVATNAYAVTFPLTNLTSATPEAANVLSANRHHGVAVPAEDGAIIMSVGDADGNRTGVRVYEGDDEVASFTDGCEGLHGYAVVGDHYIFGCANEQGGVLVVTHDHDAAEEWTARQLDFPPGATEGIFSFTAHPDVNFAVAPWGSEAMIRVNPDNDAMMESDILDLPAQQCGYALRDDSGENLLVLTVDGMLRSYHVANWSERSAVQVMNAFECSGTRPLLASVGSFAYITVPGANELLEIEVEDNDLTVHQSLSLQGEPQRMTLFRHPPGLEDHVH